MNTFGKIFRISLYGESHGKIVGCIIDGCPAGISISEQDFREDIAGRKSGAVGTTPRKEDDLPEIKSGVFNGFSTGAPICIEFENKNVRSEDYSKPSIPRPGHADFVAEKKYGGFQDYRGGGHFSGRLTLPLTAAGVVAKKIIPFTEISSHITKLGKTDNFNESLQMAIASQDSIGGIIECTIKGLPVGLGEPFFDSMESYISSIVFSVPGIKGIEFGAGFAAAEMFGSEMNDLIVDSDGTTATNNSGGINGGISNGNDIVFRVAVKPTSSIAKPQSTINLHTGAIEELAIVGRHDTCFALRVPPVISAAAAIAIADLYLASSSKSFR